ncbi:putative ABC transport system permease protein [Micromonospora luteifusca]|uniref:ABC transport system permease protein n=1 Tax=Micromonospora luteifusca TaxID=709860 RepID=A0ABS2LMA7_9ACTN|nr:FtsX-like permease family protein [Micromonospora luteifusca]MBM7489315.1 putative ABC transport system permease protein [Micromonospora luteifusca]
MSGRLLFVCRLLMRDLRRRRTETALLLAAITAATATLTLGLALNEIADRPYQQTRTATAGPDVIATPRATGQAALDELASLATAAGVTDHSGPFPIAYLTMTAHGKSAHAVIEGRDTTPVSVNRPAVTDGTWVRPGGVVVERAFADALGIRTGDTVDIDGHPLRVIGTAVTAARATYPYAGWHYPGSPLVERGGLVWVDRSDTATLAGSQPLSYTLNIKLVDPAASTTYVVGDQLTTWQEIDHLNGRLYADAQITLLVGSWLLNGLALAGVAGIVAGRIIGQRRRVGLLKAVGAGPAMIAAVHLAEYLVIGLAAAATGLAVGWFAAPVLIRPSAGLIGSVNTEPPTLRTVIAATALALVIAVAATLVPVVRAAATSTAHALADAATPPRRRRMRIWLSRQLPIALLIGVRINARRPRRARLVTVNTLITTTALVAILMVNTQVVRFDLGYTELANPRVERSEQATLVLIVVLCILALINAVVSTWTVVLDARQPLAVARTLGATPAQAGMGLALAQLLPAIPGVAAGIPAGIGLVAFVSSGQVQYPPESRLLAIALGVLLAIAALTAIPAMVATRRPVADTLRSAPA